MGLEGLSQVDVDLKGIVDATSAFEREGHVKTDRGLRRVSGK